MIVAGDQASLGQDGRDIQRHRDEAPQLAAREHGLRRHQSEATLAQLPRLAKRNAVGDQRPLDALAVLGQRMVVEIAIRLGHLVAGDRVLVADDAIRKQGKVADGAGARAGEQTGRERLERAIHRFDGGLALDQADHTVKERESFADCRLQGGRA